MSEPDVKRGRFREYLGLAADAPITGGDIHRALRNKKAGVRKMANFARMAKRKWKALNTDKGET